MAKLFDMARMSVSGEPGIGPITLLGAASGFQTFAAAGVQDGDVVSYSAGDKLANGVFTIWEVGRGIYSSAGPTITRGPLYSSSGGAAVNLTATALIWITVLSEDLILDVAASGNTTVSTAFSAGFPPTLNFSGAGIVSVGASNGSIIISATGGGGGTSSLYAIGNTAGSTTSEAAASSLTFSGAGGVSIGYSGSSVVISGATTAAQTVQTLGLYAVGNTTGSTTSETADARTLSFDGGGIASVGFSNGSIVISASSGTTIASGTSENVYALGNTTGASSSSLTLTNWTISGAGAASVGFSTTAPGAGVLMISVASDVTSATSMGLSAVGNTTGSTSAMSQALTAETFSGAGLVSVGFSGGSIIVSGTSASQTAPTLSVYAIGNTTTSTSSGVIAAGSLSFDGGGAVSVGVSGSSVVISAPVPVASATSNQDFALGNTTGQSSSTTATITNFSISGAGGVSAGWSTTAAGAAVLVLSGVTTAAQTAAGLNVYAVGNTTTSVSSGAIQAGSLSFDGAGAVSIGISGSSVVISAPTAIASGTAENMAALGNTTGATSSSVLTLTAMSVSGAGGVSAGFSTTGAGAGVLVLSGSTYASATTANLSAIGNTTAQSSSSSYSISGLSVSGAGGVSVGLSTTAAGAVALIISGATTAASGTAENMVALGNTTAAASSSVLTLSAISVSATGGLSAGFSTTGAGAGVLVLSAATQTAAGLSVYAVGNTTTSVSSGVIQAGSLSFDGAGNVSVGISGSSVVISGPAASSTGGWSAVGNTTGATSSMAVTFTALSVSGAGGASVGFSSSTMIVSVSSATSMGMSAVGNTAGSTTSMTQGLTAEIFSGSGGASVGFSGGSIVVSAPAPITMSLWEPTQFQNSTSTTLPIGTMAVAPMQLPEALTLNQVQLLSSRQVAAASISVGTQAASTTATATASWGSTQSLVVYSRQAGTASDSFTTFSSTTVSIGITASHSASFSGASRTVSQTASLSWAQGSSTNQTSTMSTTFSSNTAAATWTSAVLPASTSNFTGFAQNPVPMAASFPAGLYLVGIMGSTASGTGTGNTLLTVAAPTWLGTLGMIAYPNQSIRQMGAALNASTDPFPGVGSTSSAGSAVPGTIAWLTLSAFASFHQRPWFQMGMI